MIAKYFQKIFGLILATLLALFSFCQAEQDSTSAKIIASCRSAVLPYLHAQLPIPVQHIQDSCQHLNPEKSIRVFHPLELRIIAILNMDWKWMMDTTHLRSFYTLSDLGTFVPRRDSISDTLRHHFITDLKKFQAQVANAPGNKEDKEFLRITLLETCMLLGLPISHRYFQETVSSWLQWSRNHRNAEYLRSRYAQELEIVGPLGGFWIGPSRNQTQGKTQNVLDHGYGVSFGVACYAAGILASFGGSITYHDWSDSTVWVKRNPWKKQDEIMMSLATLQLGYPLVSQGGWAFIPSMHVAQRELRNMRLMDKVKNPQESDDWTKTTTMVWGGGLEFRKTWGSGLYGLFTSLALLYDKVGESYGYDRFSGSDYRMELRFGFMAGKTRVR